MQKLRLSDFKYGWIIGNFEPSILRNPNFEVGIKFYKKGDFESMHLQLKATEITVVISGEVRIGNINLISGEVLLIPPNEPADFEAITDCALVCIKSPSDPNDKVIVQ